MHNVYRVRRNQNDHVVKQTTQTLNPPAGGSGRKHHITKPTTRLLYEKNPKLI